LALVARGSKLDSHVVIGTPGTTLDWVLKLRVLDPKKVAVFVLDEADVMIDTQGHQDQTIRIYKYGLYLLHSDTHWPDESQSMPCTGLNKARQVCLIPSK